MLTAFINLDPLARPHDDSRVLLEQSMRRNFVTHDSDPNILRQCLCCRVHSSLVTVHLRLWTARECSTVPGM